MNSSHRRQKPAFVLPFNLTDAEMDLLESLVQSPVYSIMKKIMEGYIAEARSALESARDPVALYQAQGRIHGARSVEALPKILAEQRKQQKERAQREEYPAGPAGRVMRRQDRELAEAEARSQAKTEKESKD